ncbi:MAG TPA: xanthine dehydrogenase family protein, partial [bacterium]|nr:xanthine dehydrogenase family protein [bacterium]
MAEAGPIGKRLRRLEDPRLLRGEGRFADDLRPDGCLHVAFLRSPVASGRLADIETAGAGTVFTAGDIDGSCRPLAVHLTTPGALAPERPLLARDRVRFVGEIIAAVVAEDRYAAADAVDLIRAEIEPLPAVVSRSDGPLVHDSVPDNVYFLGKRSYGDTATAFERADAVIECRVKHPRVAAAPIECRGVVAAPDGDGVTVWTSTQVPHLIADAVAECLDIPRPRVRVVATDVGGGFGGKAQVYPEEILLAWIARRINGPVKWIETRSEHMQSASHARDQEIELSAAVRKDGRILAIRATIYSCIGAYGVRPFGPLLDPLGTASLIPGPYDIRDYEYSTYALATNQSPEGPYRGVGMVSAVLAHERLVDLTAARFGLDPAEVRRINLVRPDQMPYRSVTGHPYESGDYPRALETALAAVDYRRARDEQRAGRRIGIGLASYVEYTGAGSSTFVRRGMADIPGTDT